MVKDKDAAVRDAENTNKTGSTRTERVGPANKGGDGG